MGKNQSVSALSLSPLLIKLLSFSFLLTNLPNPFHFLHLGLSPFHEILMSRPQEHDYTGSSESLNLKETELRLGLPGSESPERGLKIGVSLFGKGLEEKHHVSGFGAPLNLKGLGLVSGSKRGFSDANIGGGKWVFSVPEADLGKKGGALYGVKGIAGLEGNGNCNMKPAMKEGGVAVPQPSKTVQEEKDHVSADNGASAPAAKAQVVGWPPIRSFRKNTMATNSTKNGDDPESKTGLGCLYVKVSMDGAPYLRKVDLKIYGDYVELSSALEKMFSCFTIGQCSSGRDGLSERCLMDLLHGSEYVLTYEDKDNDWMLVGDVPWEMFTDSCKRLRIMKGSEAIGLAPRAMEKCKSRN